jgi:hypothetical protein
MPNIDSLSLYCVLNSQNVKKPYSTPSEFKFEVQL